MGTSRLFLSKRLFRQLNTFARYVAVAACLLIAYPLSAAPQHETINLAYCEVSGFIDDENTGVGYELMNAVLERLRNRGYAVNITYVPAMRMLNGYKNEQFDLIFPIMKIKNFTLESFQKWGFDHIPEYSHPLYDGGQFVIYTHTDNERLDDLQSLLGKSTVVIAGAYIPVDLVAPTHYKVEHVETAEQAFKMVNFGRVDAFLVHKEWGKHALSEIELPDLRHGKAFEDIHGGFIAPDTDKGQKTIAMIDQIIAEMIGDGTYAEILKEFPDTKLVIRPD